MKIKSEKKTIAVLFVIYLVVLTWIILFKMQLDLSQIINMNCRSVNLVPFAGSMIVNGKADISEIILNAVVFMPFGMYLSMLDSDRNAAGRILIIFGVSFLYEALQYVLAIGRSDITDLISNTLGGAAGIGAFYLLRFILGEKTLKLLKIAAGIGTVGVLSLLGILVIYNM